MAFRRIRVVDSHTGGEPTRVVLEGGPDLGSGSLAERRERLARDHMPFMETVLLEPRGSDILVGALLVPPSDPACAAGVIFFDNVGVIGMCGHGTIGLAVTLAHLGRIRPGTLAIETAVGVISATLHDANRVTVNNVPSFRHAAGVQVEGFTGDIAWGGNWFFIAPTVEPLEWSNIEPLTAITWRIRQSLEAKGITGANGGLIDHIVLTGPPRSARNHGRNFVLCPGKAWDRSPCGTGTSAILACLAAENRWPPGAIWRQESTSGSVFEASYQPGPGGAILPSITGTAFITAEATLLIDDNDR